MSKTAGVDVPYRKKHLRAKAKAEGTFVSSQRQKREAKHGAKTPPTPEQRATIVKALEAGNFLETAAALAGVSKHVLREWVKANAQPEAPYWAKQFATEIELARERGEAAAMSLITASALPTEIVQTEIDGDGKLVKTTKRRVPGDVKALMWRLERTNPERFALRVRVEVTREVEAIFDALREELPSETFAIVCGIIARKLDGTSAAP